MDLATPKIVTPLFKLQKMDPATTTNSQNGPLNRGVSENGPLNMHINSQQGGRYVNRVINRFIKWSSMVSMVCMCMFNVMFNV